MTFNNMISDSYKSAEPQIGMGATFLSFTDRNPGTITEIISPKQIRIERCDHEAVPKEGGYVFGENIPQIFKPRTVEEIEADKEPRGEIYSLRRNGKWIIKGASLHQSGLSAMIGERDYYYDPHF